MKTQNAKLVPEIQILRDESMLTVTTIKKKFVDQMDKLSVSSLPDSLPKDLAKTMDVIGFYRETFKDSLAVNEMVIIKRGDKFVRIDIYILCNHLAQAKFPFLWEWNKGEKEMHRTYRYDQQQRKVESEVELMKSNVPQLFTT